VKTIFATLFAIFLLAACSHAQSHPSLSLGPNIGVLPPLEYDYPYQGKLTEIGAGKDENAASLS